MLGEEEGHGLLQNWSFCRARRSPCAAGSAHRVRLHSTGLSPPGHAGPGSSLTQRALVPAKLPSHLRGLQDRAEYAARTTLFVPHLLAAHSGRIRGGFIAMV